MASRTTQTFEIEVANLEVRDKFAIFFVFLGVCGVILCVVRAVVGAQICTVIVEVVSEYKRGGVMRD